MNNELSGYYWILLKYIYTFVCAYCNGQTLRDTKS